MTDYIYDGKTCGWCGTNERYKLDNRCVKCTREYKRKRYHATKRTQAKRQPTQNPKDLSPTWQRDGKCQKCGILLSHPLGGDNGNGLCLDCAGKVLRFRDVNPASALDFMPSLTEY